MAALPSIKRRRFLACERQEIEKRVLEMNGKKWTQQDYAQLQRDIGQQCPNVKRKVLSIIKQQQQVNSLLGLVL
jgi:hypothetical protein